MIDMDFSFERSPWEAELENLQPGEILPAGRLLTMLEGESDTAVEAVFLHLEDKQICLDLTDLPLLCGDGEAAIRLRREQDLVAKGFRAEVLEETDPLRLYLEELAAVSAHQDADALAAQLLEGRDVAESLTNALLPLVWQRAIELTGRGVLLLDLIQEGSMGLLTAISTYSGGTIAQHCDPYIRFAMAKTVTLQARAAGVGQKMRQALEDYRAVDERLLGELGRNATIEEIAQALHMTPEEAGSVADMFAAAQMLQKAKAPAEETPDDEQAVEDTAYFQTRQRVDDLLSGLNEKETKLLKLRFGLEGGRALSPAEAGKKLGLTPEEVVTTEAAALEKLRKN